MTFEEWAGGIDARVLERAPGVSVKRKLDEHRRWIRGGRECQVHAISDSVAAFAALRRNGILTDCSFSCHVEIGSDSEEAIVTRILWWLT